MIVPLWYLIIWILTTCAYLAVCIVIAWRKLWWSWPSLFMLGLDSIVFFIVGQMTRHNYPVYVRFYSVDSLLVDAMHIWLAWDIARAIPSGRLFPKSFKRWALVLTAAAGALVGILTAPTQLPQTLASYRALYGASISTFWAMAVTLLIMVMINGIGFSRTGFWITFAALVRQLSSLIVSSVLSRRVSRTVFRAVNTTDTVISLIVAISWAWTLANALRHDRTQRHEWLAAASFGDAVHD